MENSIHSTMENSNGSKELTAASEESGWTLYLEDILSSQNEEAASGNSSSTIGGGGGGGSSMVSDAASCVAWNPPAHVRSSDGSKKLSFKKKKERKALADDSLEDTASSPVSSPKVRDHDHMDMNPDKKEDAKEIFQEKESGCNNHQETETSEIREVSAAERRNGCNELRKRGLCLVPLSVLLHYLG